MQKRSALWLGLLALFALQGVTAYEDHVYGLLLSPALDIIDASWALDAPTGDVVRYHVSWVADDGSTYNCHVDSPSTNTLACDVRPTLDSCTHYTVAVQPQKEQFSDIVDTGTPAYSVGYTLAGDVTISNAECVANDDLSITVTWEGPGECVEYNVSYTGTVLWGNHGSPYNSLTTRDLTASFPDLLPYTRYFVAVSASGADGGASCNTTTPEKAPSAPMSLETKIINSDTVRLYWDLPYLANGILTQYTVRWKLDNDTMEEDTESVPTSQLTYDVKGLQECAIYLFSVTASTSAGEGPETSKKDSPMATEPGAPELVCDDVEWTNYVEWSAPTASCPIDGYNIHYTMDILWSDDEDSEWLTVPASETTFQLNNTTPYSDYTYEIRAIVAGGVRGSAGTCTIRTQEAAPSAPQGLTLNARTDDSLLISWWQPAVLNGKVRFYTIDCTSQTTGIVVSYTEEAYLYENTCDITGLTSSTGYFVEVRATTVEEGDPALGEYFTISSTTTTKSPASSESSKSNTTAFIFISISTAFVIFIVVIIIRQCSQPTGQQSSHPRTQGGRPAYNASHSQIRSAIRRFESEPESLTQAFAGLKARSRNGRTNVGRVPQNVPKNRDMNFLPFDDTRVKLSGGAEMTSDYINASHVKDAAGRQKIIASQAPTDVTLADFWQMVWQENVKIIVMLTKCEENGQERCCQYWPDSTDDWVCVGAFSVRLWSSALDHGLCRRKIGLQKGEHPPRVIKQFHLTDWPERGVPESQTAILQLLDRVRAEGSVENKILVHCSAGDGRTGTFIALWNLQQKALSGEILDVDRTILEMRKDRRGLIQTESQYLFVFKCIATYLTVPSNSRTAENRSDTRQAPARPPRTPAPSPPARYTEAPPAYESLFTNPAFQSSNSDT